MTNSNHQSPEDKAIPRFRFAPSPNGRLHLGHAYSALYCERAAMNAGGELLLRIEDIDTGRTRPEFVDGILEDMDWLGIAFQPEIRRQSDHFADYQKHLRTLDRMGLVYPCAATRSEISAAIAGRDGWLRDPDGSPLYPGLWRNKSKAERDALLSSGEPVAWRLDMAKAIAKLGDWSGKPLTFIETGTGPDNETGDVETRPEIWGDVVLARKDTPTSYHLSVVADDADQNITHVTRGQDLFYATSIHRLLQELLNLPAPKYDHHKLIRDEDQRKLSKSAGDTSLETLRKSGATAADIRKSLRF